MNDTLAVAVTLHCPALALRLMNNDQINELLSLMGQQIKENAELRVETNRRFEQLTEVMVNGFLRLEDKLGERIDNVAARVDHLTDRVDHLTDRVDNLTGRVDHLTDRVDNLTGRVDHLTDRVDHLTGRVDYLTERVDHLTDEVTELKTDMREVKEQSQETNRRLGNIFEHTGQLTETTHAAGLRLSRVETSLQPTNAELDARLKAVEAQLRSAS
ncbi:hypothetical protein IC235_09005 [Hymenobacter sp. BT664]|uniref:t-SNARE coiled-coil homology domain-containing protein n=1 Tax=Hymenobacter montanus TaxID=2771359 RepID=A0A927GJE3_9BACT|nr:hypothetical protein [Hymenobacter montanus]MBD2768026.1 hypothetical protein [Hymenobacter montanus]